MADAVTWVETETLADAPENLEVHQNMRVNWSLFRALPTFNMKNGNVEDASSILVRATIPVNWHWIPVVGMPSELAVTHLDAYIRSHLYHLTKNRPTSANDAQIRKIAICLGVMRAAATTYYRIAPADIIVGELARPYLRAYKNAAEEVVYSTVADTVPVEGNADRDILIGNLQFSAEEQNAIGELVKCGMGVIPMQGYSLTMTSHHYLSDAGSQSRKVYAVVEKAYWSSQGLKDWFTADLAMLQDACWHKSTHPVNMDYKIDRAMDMTVKDMLIAAGAGACASRLPAAETELRMASSYESLLSTVSPMFELCGGSIDTTPLTFMIDLVKSFSTRAVQTRENPMVPREWRDTVIDRRSAIKKLGSLLTSNQDMVAWCYGFYSAQSESMSVMGGASGTDTLKTSFSLSKLKNQSHAAYINGYTAFADYQAARNRMRMEGKYEAPKFTFK